MNDITLHVQLTGLARTTANLESITTAADAAVWRSAAEVLRERMYATADGVVRVPHPSSRCFFTMRFCC
jgi:hypothetical protein